MNAGTPPTATAPAARGLSAPAALRILALGLYFGIVLAKSEVARWERIHAMFRFAEARLFLVIGVAIAVALVSMQAIKRFGLRDVTGAPIHYKPKPLHRGTVIGGLIFGAGWAVAGACPGPIYVQLGAGAWPAAATLLGALTGMFAYAALKPRLPH